MESTIRETILKYCEGNYHCEFCIEDLDTMVEEIKDLAVNAIINHAYDVGTATDAIRENN